MNNPLAQVDVSYTFHTYHSSHSVINDTKNLLVKMFRQLGLLIAFNVLLL